MATSESSNDNVSLKSSDGQIFEVSRKAVEKSALIKEMLELLGDDDDDEKTKNEPTPLDKVHSECLKKIIAWLNHHANDLTVEEGEIPTPVVPEEKKESPVKKESPPPKKESPPAKKGMPAKKSFPSADAFFKFDAWDKEFIDKMGSGQLIQLLLAANFMQIIDLVDLLTKAIAYGMHGKKPEEIRRQFGITNDLSKEEVEQIKRENAWCDGCD